MAISILGALYQRHTTGKGRRLQIAMQDAQLQYIRGAFVQHARTGEPAMRNGARPLAGGMAPSGIYPVQARRPERLGLCLHQPHQSRALAPAVEGHRAARTCSTTRDLRRARRARKHEAEVDAMIADWTRRHDKHEAMRLIGAAGVPAGAVLDTGDLLAEPTFASAASSRPSSTRAGELRMPTFPVRFDGKPRRRSSRRRCSASTPPKCSATGSA